MEGLLGDVLDAVEGVSEEPPEACGRLESLEDDLARRAGRVDVCVETVVETGAGAVGVTGDPESPVDIK
jgi:hypothetical protein